MSSQKWYVIVKYMALEYGLIKNDTNRRCIGKPYEIIEQVRNFYQLWSTILDFIHWSSLRATVTTTRVRLLLFILLRFSRRYVRATIAMTTGTMRSHGYSVQFVPRGFTKCARVFMADISMTLFVRIGQDNIDGQQLNIRQYDGGIRVIFFFRFYEVNNVSGFFGCIVQLN